MKKTTKVGIGVLVGALALTIADDFCRRKELNNKKRSVKYWKKRWRKEMNDRIDWGFLARKYRWNRDFFGLEAIDKEYDECMRIT